MSTYVFGTRSKMSKIRTFVKHLLSLRSHTANQCTYPSSPTINNCPLPTVLQNLQPYDCHVPAMCQAVCQTNPSFSAGPAFLCFQLPSPGCSWWLNEVLCASIADVTICCLMLVTIVVRHLKQVSSITHRRVHTVLNTVSSIRCPVDSMLLSSELYTSCDPHPLVAELHYAVLTTT
jgi:hypothetical protein